MLILNSIFKQEYFEYACFKLFKYVLLIDSINMFTMHEFKLKLEIRL